MKLTSLIIALLFSTFASADINWSTYSDKALAMAKDQGKKVVLGFHKKGCGTCHAQDAALEKAGVTKKNNVVFLKVQRKNPDHTKVYERFGLNSRQWAAIILLDKKKEIARINPGTTRGEQITNLVNKI